MSNYDSPFVGSIKTVKDEWIDYNGHFNMAYYLVLFDECLDEAMILLGLGPEYVEENGASYFTLQANVSYLQELPAKAPVQTSLQILDFDEKRLHYVLQMRHADEGWVAAIMEAISIHVDMNEKRSSPFPDEVLAKMKDMHSAHKSYEIPPQVGQPVGIRRKK